MDSLWDSLTGLYDGLTDIDSSVVDAFTYNAANYVDGAVNAATAAVAGAQNGRTDYYIQETETASFWAKYGNYALLGGAALLAFVLLKRK